MLRQRQIRHFQNADISALRALATTFEAGELAVVENTKRLYMFDGTDFVQLLGSTVYRASGLDFTTAEPAAPTSGDTYWAEGNGNGSVTGQIFTDQFVYEWDSTTSTWVEVAPVAGDVSISAAGVYYFDGANWVVTGQSPVREELTPTGTNTLPNTSQRVASTTDVLLIVNQAQHWSGSTTPAFTVTNNVADATITWSAANAGYSLETYDEVYVEYLPLT